MPAVPWISFTSGDNQHSVQARLVNWYEEVAPEEDPRLIPTPGLLSVVEGLSGPIRGLYQRDNLVNGELIAAAGDTLYRIDNDLAVNTIATVTAGTTPVYFASTAVQSVALIDGLVYEVSETSATLFPVELGADVAGNIVSVLVANNRYIYVDNSGAGRIWWSDELDPQTIQGFATLEASPDGVLAGVEINGSLAFFGPNTVELWAATSNPDAPFVRRPGGVLDRGIFSANAIAKADFGLFIVGEDAVVYRFSNFSPARVSTHGIETILEDLTQEQQAEVRLSAHAWRGHQFIQIDVPSKGTFVYDIATRKGHERASLNQELYRGAHYARCFGRVFVGDRYSGQVLQMSEDSWGDAGDDVERIGCLNIPVVSGTPILSNLALDVTQKNSDVTDNPDIKLRWSYNRGDTWGNKITRFLGNAGDTDNRVIFGPLGRGRFPGVLFEVSCVSKAGIGLGPVRIAERRV